MTAYHISNNRSSPLSAAARAARAKRKAMLERVRAQRAKSYAKKTVKEWIEIGAIIRGSTFKERFQDS